MRERKKEIEETYQEEYQEYKTDLEQEKIVNGKIVKIFSRKIETGISRPNLKKIFPGIDIVVLKMKKSKKNMKWIDLNSFENRIFSLIFISDVILVDIGNTVKIFLWFNVIGLQILIFLLVCDNCGWRIFLIFLFV